jgi:hypothetical protein
MAIEHNTLAGSQTHEPKGIEGASVGQVYAADGLGSGSWISLPSTSSSYVPVTSLADLPAPSGGVITLADNTVYLQTANVDVGTNRFILGNNTTYGGVASIGTSLTYTGTGTLFTSVDKTSAVTSLTILALNGEVFDHFTTSLKIFRLTDCTVLCDRFGTYAGTDWAARLTNVSVLPYASRGIVCSGTCRNLTIETTAIQGTAGVFLDKGTCVFDSLIVNTGVMDVTPGTTFMKGVGSANVAVDGLIRVVHCQLTDTGGTLLDGYTSDEVGFEFDGNFPIPDTMQDAHMYISTPASTTGTASWVQIAGTFTALRDAQFTVSPAGRITFDGNKTIAVPVTASFVMSPDSGAANDVFIAIYKNGSRVVASEKSNVGVSSADSVSMTLPWQIEFAPGDYIEFWTTVSTGNAVTANSASVVIN